MRKIVSALMVAVLAAASLGPGLKARPRLRYDADDDDEPRRPKAVYNNNTPEVKAWNAAVDAARAEKKARKRRK